MLVDVRLHDNPLLRALSDGRDPERLQRGVYRDWSHNFNHTFRDTGAPDDFDLDFPDLGDFESFGVADSVAQVVAALPSQVVASAQAYVVAVVQVNKRDQPAWGGWRWHKWGPYIGQQSPTAEYLADEPLISEVWCYSVYAVRESERAVASRRGGCAVGVMREGV